MPTLSSCGWYRVGKKAGSLIVPTVNTYGARKIDTAKLPRARLTAAETPTSQGAELAQEQAQGRARVADTFGALGAAAIRMGAQTYARMQQQARDEADQTAFQKASNRLSEWKTKTLYGDQGAFTKMGEAAFTVPEQVRTDFDKVSGQIAQDLKTPRQRDAFEKLRSNEWQRTNLEVFRHVDQQRQEFRAGEYKGFLTNQVNDAIRSAEDPAAVGVSLGKISAAIDATAPSLGYGQDAITAQKAAAASDVHVGVIHQLLALGQDGKAKIYFEAHKSAIAGDALDQVTSAVDVGSLRGASQQKADAILASRGTLDEQLAKAKDLEPKLRDAVEQRLEHANVVKDKQKQDALEQSQRASYDILDRTGDVTQIPPATWSSYTGVTRSAMQSYARQRAEGIPVKTDLPTYYALMQQAADEPSSFIGQNLLNYKHKLDDTEFKQLSNLQLAIKNGNRSASEKDLGGFRTKSEIVDDTLAQYGIQTLPSKQTEKEKTAVAQLRRMLDQRVDVVQQSGKKVTNVEIQQALDDLLAAKHTTPGSWWALVRPFRYDLGDRSMRVVDLTPADIPESERPLIEDALRRRGQAVTDQTVLDLYIEAQLRGGK